jgi:hypothetical protein
MHHTSRIRIYDLTVTGGHDVRLPPCVPQRSIIQQRTDSSCMMRIDSSALACEYMIQLCACCACWYVSLRSSLRCRDGPSMTPSSALSSSLLHLHRSYVQLRRRNPSIDKYALMNAKRVNTHQYTRHESVRCTHTSSGERTEECVSHSARPRSQTCIPHMSRASIETAAWIR